ncbi:hypothetical protein V7024_18205 [Bacillus sp. JJ864]|uniref:hypothetical protein n=1 Tax=Bacillus sp. JJ864 TaxID=3122975 RepID=UPI002FFF5385
MANKIDVLQARKDLQIAIGIFLPVFILCSFFTFLFFQVKPVKFNLLGFGLAMIHFSTLWLLVICFNKFKVYKKSTNKKSTR